MIPFEEIDSRLEKLGKDRAWLATESGRSAGSIRSALAPNASDKHRSPLLQKVLTDAIEQEEQRQLGGSRAPQISGLYEVRQTPEQAELTDLASRAVNAPSLADFCLSAIMHRANEIMRNNVDPVTGLSLAPEPENIVAFDPIPLIHAAAGSPVDSDTDTFTPLRPVKAGRFACQLHGDSMSPRFPDGSIVILRDREQLKRPVLKRGEIYLFLIAGEKTLKVYTSRIATESEIAEGITYTSPSDGKTKVRVLRSLNPDYPEIVVRSEVHWLGWLDIKDN